MYVSFAKQDAAKHDEVDAVLGTAGAAHRAFGADRCSVARKTIEMEAGTDPKHPMADAVNYALNQWPAITTFLEDATVPIDNNASER